MTLWEVIKQLINELKPVWDVVFWILVIGSTLIVILIIVTVVIDKTDLLISVVCGGLVFYLSILLILGFIIRINIIVIDETKVVIVERLEKFYTIYEGGYHVLVPFIDSIQPLRLYDPKTKEYANHEYIDTRMQIIDPDAQDASTKDNIALIIDSVANFRVVDAKKAVYEVKDLYQSILELMLSSIRNEVGRLTYDELIEGKEKIEESLTSTMSSLVSEEMWGVRISNVGFQEIKPSEKMQKILDRRAIAEQEAVAVEKEAAAQSKAIEMKANAEKIAIEKVAEAREQEILSLKSAFQEGAGDFNTSVLMLKYFEVLKEMSKGESSKIFMPFEVMPLMSSLGSMAEMVGSDKKQNPLNISSIPILTEGDGPNPEILKEKKEIDRDKESSDPPPESEKFEDDEKTT
ncbi:MAG: hypothetical protein B6244_07280 [Candidatus Cloacimonetes bacterium 4572_55]|nr:MAG: hypothetical protein B6244_07280 [Candidatus Cloacimonetes bacterium 4572_55]